MMVNFRANMPGANINPALSQNMQRQSEQSNANMMLQSSSTPTIPEEIPQKPKRRGPVRYLKDIISSWKKLGTSAGEYTKGAVKGLVQGAIGGCVAYTALCVAKKPKASIPAAIATAAAILGGHLWNASIQANRKKADVDHGYKTTPILNK